MPQLNPHLFGWHPDVADHRDYQVEHTSVAALFGKLKMRTRKCAALPSAVDWREYCGPVEDQHDMATGAAHACAAMVQQFERLSSGRLMRPSRLFVHSTATRLASAPPGAEVSLRDVLKAIVRCGVPPEEYWPYDASHLAREPDPFVYSFEREYRALRYLRLDSRNLSGGAVLERLKSFLASGFFVAFGFVVCSSIGHEADIPYPTSADTVLGGHAVSAVGYDDTRRIRSDTGALLVRNSWGKDWGDDGFGWLPYSYVKDRLAVDFWTLLKPAWLRSGEFRLPSRTSTE